MCIDSPSCSSLSRTESLPKYSTRELLDEHCRWQSALRLFYLYEGFPSCPITIKLLGTHSSRCNYFARGFRPTTRYMGVKISVRPAATSESAAFIKSCDLRKQISALSNLAGSDGALGSNAEKLHSSALNRSKA